MVELWSPDTVHVEETERSEAEAQLLLKYASFISTCMRTDTPWNNMSSLPALFNPAGKEVSRAHQPLIRTKT